MKRKMNSAHVLQAKISYILIKSGLIIGCLLTVATGQIFAETVTKIADTNDGVCDSDCSLREAIFAAPSGGEIVFASPLFDSPQIIQLSDAAGFQTLLIEKNLTIMGKGANLLSVRGPSSGLTKFRVFTIAVGLTVNLSGLKITGGSVIGEGGGVSTFGSTTTITRCHITDNVAAGAIGGGIRNSGNGTLTIIDSTISNNIATFSTGGGGGIHSDGALNLINSTVSDNTKTGTGDNAGGIWVRGTALITNSTVTNNGASGGTPVGGIIANLGNVTIRNTIVAGNVNLPDVSGFTFISEGYNLIGVAEDAALFNQPGDQAGTDISPINPRLDPLADYGGTTPTHHLQLSPVLSPAIDKGKRFDLNTDQRGSIRPVDNLATANAPGGDGSDIGAYEANFSVPLIVTKTADTNDGLCDADCSLREAIVAAGNGNTIEFSALFDTPQTITLSDAAGFRELLISDKSLSIAGKGAQLLTIRRDLSATGNFRIFRISTGNAGISVNVNLSGMTITGGRSIVSGGGGIRFDGAQNSLTVNNCHITGNTVLSGASGSGGGIHSSGTLKVYNSTISNNSVTNSNVSSAGIYSISSGGFVLSNSTVSGNVVSGTGNGSVGGIFTNIATITNSTVTDNETVGAMGIGGIIGNGDTLVRGTIIAGNRNNLIFPDVGGGFFSQGFNIIGNVGSATGFNQISDQSGTSAAPIDPLLAPIALNGGGTTPTHALIVGSRAIDSGNSFGLLTDQRGSLRPLDNPGAPSAPGGDNSDVGAFESPRFPPIVVTKTADTNDGFCDADCSLREATVAAVPGTEIIFSPLFDTAQTITLTSEIAMFDKGLSIAGKGAHLLTIRRDPAAAAFRIFRIGGSDSRFSGLNLSGMTITGGRSITLGGGGVRLDRIQNSLIISNCHITNNISAVGNTGGGVHSVGRLAIYNSTISNNSVTGSGNNSTGGIYSIGPEFIMINSTVSGNFASGSGNSQAGGILAGIAVITNSTITDNEAFGTGSAGGITTFDGTTIRGTIIAANRNNSTVPDATISNGGFMSQGFNLIGNALPGSGFTDGVNNDQVGTGAFPRDPRLDTLANYGGTMPTHRPQTDSPAIDQGNSFGLTTDQRNGFRPVDFSLISDAADGADIGAFEISLAPTAALVMISGRVLTPDGRGLRNARVVLNDMNGNTRTVLTGSFGYYRFDDLTAGETFIINVVSKSYQFAPQVVAANGNITDLNFFAGKSRVPLEKILRGEL